MAGIDPNIPLSITPTPSPAIAIDRIVSLRDLNERRQAMAAENQARADLLGQQSALLRQKQQDAVMAQRALTASIQRHLNPDTGELDIPGVYTEVAQQFPDVADHFVKGAEQAVTSFNAVLESKRKAQEAANSMVLGALRRVDAAPEDQKQAAWSAEHGIFATINQGRPTGIPDVFPGTDRVKSLIAGLTSPEEQQKLEEIKARTGAQQAAAEHSQALTDTERLKQAGTLPEAPLTAGERERLKLEARRVGISEAELKLKQDAAKPFAQGAAGPAGAGPVALGQKDEGYLSTLPPQTAAQVKALAEGRMQFPGGFALKSEYWQNMLSAVARYDPSFDAVNYNARAKTRADFTSGKSATSINAINTAIGHLHTLSDAADALGNTNYQWPNAIKNWVKTEFGSSAVPNFQIVRKAVADELTRVWRGAGGSEGDIKTWTDQISTAGSPAQLHEPIVQIGHLLESKLQSLGTQYGQGMGTAAIEVISPEARQTLDRLEQGGGSGAGVIYARDPQGVLHQAPAGTPLPDGWKRESR